MKNLNVILMFLLSGSAYAFPLKIPTELEKANYALVCDVATSKGHEQVGTVLDGIFGGNLVHRRQTQVLVNGKFVDGFIEIVDDQDENGHGVKHITLWYGDQMSLQINARPAFGGDGLGRYLAGNGTGRLLRFGSINLGTASCDISTKCRDSRLCE